MFIKIRAHRGEFLNEKARTCALSRGCAFFPKLANVTVTFFLATRCIQAVDVKHVLTLQPDHVTIVHENVNVFVKFLVFMLYLGAALFFQSWQMSLSHFSWRHDASKQLT